jgi:putative PIN family toxin of toxin-antitoxin system
VKVVFDTNTLISAIIKRGSVPDLALTETILFHEILASLKTLKELNQVLQRRKFDAYLKEESRREFYRSFATLCHLIEVTSKVTICRDEKDNKFLDLCADGKADYLIIGDQDLLSLNSFEETKIIHHPFS